MALGAVTNPLRIRSNPSNGTEIPSSEGKIMNKKPIMQADIQSALMKFINSGGLIKHLPDQLVPSRIIASDREIYEKMEEIAATMEIHN